MIPHPVTMPWSAWLAIHAAEIELALSILAMVITLGALAHLARRVTENERRIAGLVSLRRQAVEQTQPRQP